MPQCLSATPVPVEHTSGPRGSAFGVKRSRTGSAKMEIQIKMPLCFVAMVLVALVGWTAEVGATLIVA